MPGLSLIPAAQYVRMSTDEQPNSIALQEAAIQKYAATKGYEIVSTYSDPWTSGIEIKHRPGLSQLLQDAIGGESCFQAILVYDVSRWGRFQDIDESAHYEFLCRSAGIPVHYCAEQFQDMAGLSRDLMKALKRTMAAEYSRELSVKVKEGMSCLAGQGFRCGAAPGFGMRRMLLSPDGSKKHILQPHERKYLKSDNVTLVPGPKREVECIRTIFTLAAEQEKSPSEITAELNRRAIRFTGGNQWNESTVYRLLKNEKYMGCHVWGKTELPFALYERSIPPERWIRKPSAFEPIVSADQFARVQELMQQRRTKPAKPDEFLFNRMKEVWAREGKLTEKLLLKSGYFDYRSYVRRFGSVMRAYELIGYNPSAHAFASVDAFNKLRRLRSGVLMKLKELFPSQVRVLRVTSRKQREIVEVGVSVRFAIHICRPTRPTTSGKPRWLLTGQPSERDLAGLICFANEALSELTDFYIVPEFGGLMRRYKVLGEDHPWLNAGKRLDSLSEFCHAAKQVVSDWLPRHDFTVAGDVILRNRTSTVTLSGKELVLPDIEAALLKSLVQNAGVVVPRAKLSEVARLASREKEGRSTLPRVHFVTNHMSILRRKLGPFRNRIFTAKGEGYIYRPAKQADSLAKKGPRQPLIFVPNLSSSTPKPTTP